MLSARNVLLTTLALLAFAANSWCCRLALRGADIDPLTFSALRLASGALILQPLARALERTPGSGGSLISAGALLVYALAFSLAYITLDTGIGALILFGSVQLTMIGRGLAQGERPGSGQWAGLTLALCGLVYLVRPGLSAPSLPGALSMAAAGVAWGVYSLRGRGETRPFAATAGNFLRAAPLALAFLPLAGLFGLALQANRTGILLALLSGAVASALGYVVWYMALGGMSATTAGIVQLAVPVLAAVGGVLLLGERPGARLALAGAAVLGGVAWAVTGARRRAV